MAKNIGLTMEILEPRCTPAGNVIAYKDGLDNLIIQGDADNNAIRIEPLGGTEGVMVSGLQGTTINGTDTPFVALIAGNPLGSIRINMNAGNDSVVLQSINSGASLQIFGDLTINYGDGGAGLWVNGIRNFFGRLQVISGNGSFFGRFTNSVFSGPVDLDATRSARALVQIQVDSAVGNLGQFGDLSIRTGRGNDKLVFRGAFQGTPPSLTPLLITNNLALDTGAGNDSLQAEFVEVRGTTSVGMGVGNDNLILSEDVFIRGVTLALGAGNDTLTIDGGSFERGLSVLSGGGLPDQDYLSLVGLTVESNLKILTGDDDDSVLLVGTQIFNLPGLTQGGLWLNMGRGHDRADVINMTVGKDIYVNLGPGDDSVSFSYVQVSGRGTVDGSSGVDLLSRINLRATRGLTLANFNP